MTQQIYEQAKIVLEESMKYADTPDRKQKLENLGADVAPDEDAIVMMMGENIDNLVDEAYELAVDGLESREGVSELNKSLSVLGQDIGKALAEVYHDQPDGYGHFAAVDEDSLSAEDGSALVYDAAEWLGGHTRVGRVANSPEIALSTYLENDPRADSLVDGMEREYNERWNELVG
jgi:hypothetical protein